MLLIPFLNNRQIGTRIHIGLRASDYQVNLDDVISRFVVHQKDVLSTNDEVPPFACKFRKDRENDLLAVANEDGDVLLYNTNDDANNTFVKSFVAHDNAVFDICWLPDKCHLLTGSGDCHVSLWDISNCKFISTFKKHLASVTSIDVCNSQSDVFATGSKDGSINVWDMREKNGDKPAVCINNAHNRKCAMNASSKKKLNFTSNVLGSVSCVAFQDSNHLASSGAADGILKIWDLRKTYLPNSKSIPVPRYQMNYWEEGSSGHGCTSLVFDSSHKKLYACSTGHRIYQFDCHTYSNDVVVYEGLRCSTYFVKIALSYDGQYLLSGSSDHKAYIWKTKRPGLPIFELPGHLAEVTSVTWSPYSLTKLVTCSDDNKVFVWKIYNSADTGKRDISSCVKYFEGYKPDSPLDTNNDGLNLCKNIKRLSLPTPRHQKNSAVKAITKFFSPVNPSVGVKSFKTFVSGEKSETILNKNKPLQASVSSITKIPVPILSPCKVLNKNNIVAVTPEKISPTKNLQQSNLQNKENSSKYIDKSTNRINILGQTKRKLILEQSTPKIRKIHSRNCGKGKHNLKHGKKGKCIPERTIMNYFAVL